MIGKNLTQSTLKYKNQQDVEDTDRYGENDTGTSICATYNKHNLEEYRDIDQYPTGGVKIDDVDIICTGEVQLPRQSCEVTVTRIKSFFCKNVDGTIISPTTMILQHKAMYQGFVIEGNCNI